MLASRASDAYGDKDADGDMKQSKELERLLLDQEVKEDEVDLDAQVEADDDQNEDGQDDHQDDDDEDDGDMDADDD